MLLVADQMEVGQLGDRVPEGVVEGAAVCSPPWRWTIGVPARVAARAAAIVSKRSPTSTSAAGRVSTIAAAVIARALLGLDRDRGFAVVGQPRQRAVDDEAVPGDVVQRPSVAPGRCVPPTSSTSRVPGVRTERRSRRSAGCPSPGGPW